jgi:hypothetical protein
MFCSVKRLFFTLKITFLRTKKNYFFLHIDIDFIFMAVI